MYLLYIYIYRRKAKNAITLIQSIVTNQSKNLLYTDMYMYVLFYVLLVLLTTTTTTAAVTALLPTTNILYNYYYYYSNCSNCTKY